MGIRTHVYGSRVHSAYSLFLQRASDVELAVTESHLHGVSRKSKSADRCELVVAWGHGRKRRLTTNGHEGSFWGDGNVLKLDYDGGYITLNLLKNG